MSRAPSQVQGIGAALVLAALALGGCASGGYTTLSRPAPKAAMPINLEQANRWWQGHTVRPMRQIDFGRGPEWKGLWFAQLSIPRGDKKPWENPALDLSLQFFLPDTAVTRQALRRGKLPSGTPMTALRWEVQRINRQEMNVLWLRLPGDAQDAFLQVRCEEWRTLFSGANDCSPEGVLQRAEPYLRAHLLQIDAPPARQASRVPAAAASVRVVSVAVEPLRVTRGGTVQLLVTYQVEGVPTASPAALIERRRIQRDGRALLDQSATVPHSAGTFTSQQTVQIPSATAAGAYTFRADVSLGAASSSREGMFEVRE